MSRPTSTLSRARRVALGGLVGAAAFAGVTASAEANFQKTLTFTCIYPYVGEQPLKVDIDAAIPATWPAKTKTPAFQLDAVATAGGNTSAAIGLIGAATAEGTTKAGATINATGASPLPLSVPIKIPKQAVADSGDLVLTASGTTPQVQFASAGPASITVDSIALTLIVRGEDGVVIQLPEDATEVPQTDGNPDTFQVSCALSPANQDRVLSQISVGPPVTPTPSPTPISDPTSSPSPSPTPTASPTPIPTVAPTPQATPPANGGFVLPQARSAYVEFATTQAATSYAVYDGATKLAERPASDFYIGGTPPVQYDSAFFTIGGLTPDTPYTWTVKATNAAGEVVGSRSFTFRTKVETVIPTPTVTPTPLPPTPTGFPLHAPIVSGLTVSELTLTTAKVCWNGGGSVPSPLYYSFSITPGATVTGDSRSGCRELTGLSPATLYKVTVVGDGAYQYSRETHTGRIEFTTPSATPGPTVVPPTPTPTVAPPTPTPTPGPEQTIPYAYSLSGSATLKSLTKGSLPLSGAISAKLGLPSGNFVGDLTLAPSTGNLTALGFLPVVAKVNLVPTEQVKGSLKSNKLTAVAKVRIKLPSVKTFGIELAGGANCQAKQISSITLNSTQTTFLPLSGGPIAGSFSISDLSGCGFLNGLVSSLTQGSGNTIALNLTPKPVA